MSEAVYLINTFMQSIIFTFLFNETLEAKKSFAVNVFFIFICIFSVHTLEKIIYINGDLAVTLRTFNLALAALFLYRSPFVRKLCSYALLWVVMLSGEFIGYFITWKLFSIEENYSVKMDKEPIGVSCGRLLVSDLMLIVVIVILFIFKFKKLKKNDLLSRLLVLAVYATAHSVYLSAYYYINAKYITQLGNMIQITFQALLYTIILVQYYSIDRMGRLARREEAVQAAQAHKKDRQRYTELADSKLRDIRALKEDLSSQLGDIKQLIDDKDQREKVDQLMDKMSERLGQIKAVNYCDDRILNAVLTIKFNDPRVRSINIQMLLYDCSRSGVDSYEMCSLVSNMLDNAIESCLKADDPTKTFIEMKSGIRSGFFVIRVTNSFVGELDTISKNGEGRGYGIIIIKEICRRHGGEYTLKQNGSEVIASAFMKVGET